MENNQELKALSMELRTELLKLENALNKLDDNLVLLQNNESMQSVWTGVNAYTSIKGCLAHSDHDKNLLKNLCKCSDYLESLQN